jgi:ABC-2 type transport system permease protein
MWAAVAAEWTKIWTLRSTVAALAATFVVTVGLSYLVALSFRSSLPTLPPERRATFDPLFPTFYPLTLSQLAIVVFAVLVVANEYSTGTIHLSLAAVPRRGVFYGAKLVAAILPIVGITLLTVPAGFAAAQAGLGPYGVSFDDAGVGTAVAGACLYLPLISLVAMGVATLLRTPTRGLGVLIPLLFIGAQGLGNVPGIKIVTQYLPDQAGTVIMHITGPPGSSRDYGPWTGVGILALWAVVALVAGYLTLRKRDA